MAFPTPQTDSAKKVARGVTKSESKSGRRLFASADSSPIPMPKVHLTPRSSKRRDSKGPLYYIAFVFETVCICLSHDAYFNYLFLTYQIKLCTTLKRHVTQLLFDGCVAVTVRVKGCSSVGLKFCVARGEGCVLSSNKLCSFYYSPLSFEKHTPLFCSTKQSFQYRHIL